MVTEEDLERTRAIDLSKLFINTLTLNLVICNIVFHVHVVFPEASELHLFSLKSDSE